MEDVANMYLKERGIEVPEFDISTVNDIEWYYRIREENGGESNDKRRV